MWVRICDWVSEAQLTQDPWAQSRTGSFSDVVHFLGCCICPGYLKPGQWCVADMAEGQDGWADLGMTPLGNGWTPAVKGSASLPPSLETD